MKETSLNCCCQTDIFHTFLVNGAYGVIVALEFVELPDPEHNRIGTPMFLQNLFKSFRPKMMLMAGLLVYVGVNLSINNVDWALILLVMMLCGITMVQNDYFDRNNDKKKGKFFASENQKKLLIFLTIFWTLLVIMVLLTQQHQIMFLAGILICF